jgi:DNA-binding response OmpR family regulator
MIVPADIAHKRILVVDDYPMMAESLARQLRYVGHEAHAAVDGMEGYEAAERVRPEFALLDVQMAKLDGYELAQKIRAQPWGKEVVLVALTGFHDTQTNDRMRKAGFNAYLVKPIAYSEIAALVAACSPRTTVST